MLNKIQRLQICYLPRKQKIKPFAALYAQPTIKLDFGTMQTRYYTEFNGFFKKFQVNFLIEIAKHSNYSTPGLALAARP